MLTDADRSEIIDIAQRISSRAARETVKAAPTNGLLTQTAFVGATAMSAASVGGSASIKIDGDTNTLTNGAQNMSGARVSSGQRLRVLVTPEGGAFITAALSPQAWTVIDEVPPLTAAGAIGFQNIDQRYRSLRIESKLRSAGLPGSVYDLSFCKINADAGATYWDELIIANGAALSAGSANRSGGFFAGYVFSGSSTGARGSQQTIDLLGYTQVVFQNHGGDAAAQMFDSTAIVSKVGWYWQPAVMAPITRIDLVPGTGTTWAVGSWSRLLAQG